MTCRILSFFAAILVAVSAFGQDCVAPCAPAAPTCAPAPTCAAAPTCAPICVPCINPLALVKNAACTAVNEVGCCAANLKARLCALKPCVSFAPCAPAACGPAPCAPCAPAACAPAAPVCDPAPAACAPAAPGCDPAPAACAPAAPTCCKVCCTIKPFQRLKAAFARPCIAAPACVAPCAPACEAPAPACAPVAPCAPATGC